jgi:hypothetical protein
VQAKINPIEEEQNESVVISQKEMSELMIHLQSEHDISFVEEQNGIFTDFEDVEMSIEPIEFPGIEAYNSQIR